MSGKGMKPMDKPTQFISFDEDRGKWEVCAEAIKLLSEINQQLCVVAIAGKYRTGKSYLMNRLFERNAGFELGATVQSHTKGIWMWARPHPKDPSKCLLLLDTEGLHDVEKGDEQHDMQLFTLAVLLSNCFVYNGIGALDDIIIHQLQLVANLTEHLKLKKKQPDGEETGNYFSKYFPSFFLVLRDFFLDLKIEGKQVTPDEYFDHALKLKPGRSKKVTDYNTPRDCIKAFFTKRRCFVLPKPVQDDNLIKHMEDVPEKDIKPEFLERCADLINTIHTEAKPFTLEGHSVTGCRFDKIAQSYVTALNEGAIPCIESTVDLMKNSECAKAMEAAFGIYAESMQGDIKAGVPLESADLLAAHQRAHEAAVKYYTDHALFDEEGTFQQKLMQQLESEIQNYVHKNNELSRAASKETIEKCFIGITENINRGKYAMKGGYEQYKLEKETALRRYYETPGLGPMSDKVLIEYMDNKIGEEEAIIKSDEALEEKDKELVTEQEKLQREQQNARAAEQDQRDMMLQVERQQRENEVNLTKMQLEFQTQQQQLMSKHQEDILEKEQSYKKMVDEGMDRYAEQQMAVIEEMRQDRKRMEENYREKSDALSDFKEMTNTMLGEMKDDRRVAQQQLQDTQKQLVEQQQKQNQNLEDYKARLDKSDQTIRQMEQDKNSTAERLADKYEKKIAEIKTQPAYQCIPYPYHHWYYPYYR